MVTKMNLSESQTKLPEELVIDTFYRVKKQLGVNKFGRDKFAANDECMQEYRQMVGSGWSHVKMQVMRDQIVNVGKDGKLGAGDRKGPAANHSAIRSAGSDDWLAKDMIRRGEEWKWLSKACKDRDGNRCRCCNSTRGLNAHHCTYENYRGEFQAELADLTTLCSRCHERLHKSKAFQNRIDWTRIDELRKLV